MDTTLHFFCGKMAAGKSTLAKELAIRHQAILISEDQWLSSLYPEEITDIPTYIQYSARLKKTMAEHVQSLLERGVSVVLDFPGNTLDQRKWIRGIFEQANVAHVLHYVDVSDDVCKQQLKERSKHKTAGAAFTTAVEFDMITKYFQAPTDSEGFTLVKYGRESL